MAKTAVVFSGRNGLDFIELRSGVMRIPDITLRLREAQAILDAMEMTTVGKDKVDLLSVVSSDDEMFFRNIQLKSLCSAIVQVGLFDRYQKTQKRPDYMVGNSNGDSAMLVCAGRQTFRELIENSQALVSLGATVGAAGGSVAVPAPVAAAPAKVVPLVAVLPMPLLSGLTLTEYSALEFKTAEGYQPMRAVSMELRKLIGTLHEEQSVDRFVNVGPASALRGSDYRQLGTGEIESVDSIELDPMLGWFWRNVRPQAAALAQ